MIDLGEEKINLSARSWMALKTECRNLEDTFKVYKVNSSSLRQSIMEQLVSGDFYHKGKVIHRSEECRKIFKQAEEFAYMSMTGFFSCLHILAAIMKDPGEIISVVLEQNRIPLHLFKQHLLTVATTQKVFATLLDADSINTVQMFVRAREPAILAVVFDDITGSTALMQKIGEDKYGKLLDYHDKLARETLDSLPDGELIKSTGDGFLVVFSRPESAIQYSLNMQNSFRGHGELQLRIGMDIGQLTRKTRAGIRDVLGRPVNNAYRIMRLADQGHILASSAVFRNVNHLPIKQAKWHHHGTYKTKAGEPDLDIYEIMDNRYSGKVMNFKRKISTDQNILRKVEKLKELMELNL